MEAYKRMSIYTLVKEAIYFQSHFLILKDYADLQGLEDVATAITF
jgi:hypothetical protein